MEIFFATNHLKFLIAKKILPPFTGRGDCDIYLRGDRLGSNGGSNRLTDRKARRIYSKINLHRIKTTATVKHGEKSTAVKQPGGGASSDLAETPAPFYGYRKKTRKGASNNIEKI